MISHMLYELLSGAEHTGSRSREHDTYVISKGTDVGRLVESYQKLDTDLQKCLVGKKVEEISL